MNDSVDLSLLQAADAHHAQHAQVEVARARQALAEQPDYWKLGAGQALSLRARRAGMLHITHGRVWATFDHADARRSTRAGDHFLSRGDSLCLQPGESLVMEPLGRGHQPSAYLSWEPVPASRGASVLPTSGHPVMGAVSRAANRLATAFAITFIAARDRCTRAERPFMAQTCK
ncbi:DUF2917 domain-containing protein [Polaromonas sp.]|uniref:DUF2917 domain-containing protein n=1 Tax=Polaromonas sp. TaxID=1869339 RepID=UPI00286D41FE|nr:DUF2917 domain-containing protein [Polaromonas sp.]